MNIQINKEALPDLRAGKKIRAMKLSHVAGQEPLEDSLKITTRFSTDGEGDEKKVDIKISSRENAGMFFSSIPMKIAKNLKNNGYVTQCQFSVSTNNNRKLYLFIYLRQASRIAYNCNFKLNVITFASVRSKISMNRTLTELGFKIVSLRFVFPPFLLLPPPPQTSSAHLPPPPKHFAIHYYFILPSRRDFEKYYHTAWYLLPRWKCKISSKFRKPVHV